MRLQVCQRSLAWKRNGVTHIFPASYPPWEGEFGVFLVFFTTSYCLPYLCLRLFAYIDFSVEHNCFPLPFLRSPVSGALFSRSLMPPILPFMNFALLVFLLHGGVVLLVVIIGCCHFVVLLLLLFLEGRCSLIAFLFPGGSSLVVSLILIFLRVACCYWFLLFHMR